MTDKNHLVERENGRYTISTDQTLLDFDMIQGYLSGESYWAKGRSSETMRRAIVGSLCFGVYEDGRQVGFARVITDYATRAYISDLFVLGEMQGRGLGKWLMQTILDDPSLDGVPSWILHTLDAHGLYEQFGFERTAHPERVMEMYRG